MRKDYQIRVLEHRGLLLFLDVSLVLLNTLSSFLKFFFTFNAIFLVFSRK